MTGPKVALAPGSAPDWVAEAIRAGGGQVVGPGDAEALVWFGPYQPHELASVLEAAPGAGWVQLPWAGVEAYADLLTPDRTWTCAKGVYAEPVAEHVLALALGGLRALPEWVRATSWGSQAGVSLFDGAVTVLGGGGITEVLLRLLQPFRCEVTVVRKRPRPMAGAALVVGTDDLDGTLPGADAVVLALALTPETRGIIGAARLQAMAPHAWLVNVARGAHVVTDDLVTALREGWIGGAALDVTDPEPLPDGHPLWDLPNCVISPHTANTLAMARPLVTERIRENVRRFGAGEALIGLVDLGLGY